MGAPRFVEVGVLYVLDGVIKKLNRVLYYAACDGTCWWEVARWHNTPRHKDTRVPVRIISVSLHLSAYIFCVNMA